MPCEVQTNAQYSYSFKIIGETRAPWTLFFCLEFWHVCLTIKFPLGMPMLGNLSNYHLILQFRQKF